MSAPHPVALARALVAREGAPRAATARLQQERLDALVRHARAHSAHYRSTLPASGGRVELAALPTIDKATVVAAFDEVVCDPRLRLAALRAHLAGPDRHLPFAGGH